jgi:hypothetical protein
VIDEATALRELAREGMDGAVTVHLLPSAIRVRTEKLFAGKQLKPARS